MTEEDILATILARAIRDEINEEIVRGIKDPSYTPQLSPIEFETPEMAEEFRKNWDELVNRKLPGE